MNQERIDIEKIGKYIIELRQKKGVTQLDLADAIFVSRKTISKIETGRYGASLETLKSIADYFEITLDDLINCEPQKKSIMVNGTLPPNKLTKIFISSIVLVALFFLFLYWVTTYNKIRVYTLYSTSSTANITGHYIKTVNRRIFSINEVKVSNNVSEGENYFDIEYTVFVNDTVIQKVGDISKFNTNNLPELKLLKEYIEDIGVYIIDDLPNFGKASQNNYKIQIRYINENQEEKTLDINFKMDVFFSNNKLFYEKYEI